MSASVSADQMGEHESAVKQMRSAVVGVILVMALGMTAAVLGCQESSRTERTKYEQEGLTTRAQVQAEVDRCRILAEKGQFAACFKR